MPRILPLVYFLIFEQIQRKVYREVLVAGDLSREDISRVAAITERYPNYDTAELVYGNDTVYFAQPSLSQFTPGGSGAGTFIPPEPIGLKDPPNNTLALTGRNTPKNYTGVVLRHVPPACWRCGLTS